MSRTKYLKVDYPVAAADPEKQTDHTPNTLEVEVYYSLGGTNYFSGGMTEPRGVYLGVTPIRIESRGNGLVSRAFGLFSGKKRLLQALKRVNDKAGRECAEKVHKGLDGRVGDAWDLVERVLKENGLRLTTAAKVGELHALGAVK